MYFDLQEGLDSLYYLESGNLPNRNLDMLDLQV